MPKMKGSMIPWVQKLQEDINCVWPCIVVNSSGTNFEVNWHSYWDNPDMVQGGAEFT